MGIIFSIEFVYTTEISIFYIKINYFHESFQQIKMHDIVLKKNMNIFNMGLYCRSRCLKVELFYDHFRREILLKKKLRI